MSRNRRMPDGVVATVFGRLAIALAAGVDLRRAWTAESARVPAAWRGAMESVARSLAAGRGLAESLRDVHGVFPPLVCVLADVGEQTGREAEVFRDLGTAMSEAVRSRRTLVTSLIRPMLQLAAAVAAVGLLIVISGFIRDERGGPIDVLGLGLTGRSGLAIYGAAVLGCCVAVAATLPWAVRSWRDRGVVRRIAARLPLVGPAVTAAESAAWCRTAAVAAHAGLDAGRLVTLAAAAAPGMRIDADRVEQSLRDGAALDEALRATGRFSPIVLEAVAVGEMTGTTAETLERLATRLDDEARAGFQASVKLLAFLVWAAVAAVIAVVIYRVFSSYVALLRDAGRPL